MPLPVVAAIGTYASALGIYSFFDDALSGDVQGQQIRSELNALQSQLNTLEALVDANIQQELGDGYARMNAALGQLQVFAAEESANARARIISEVPGEANLALETLISDVRPLINDATSLDTLILAYTYLHYSILGRQLIATTLESGPLGSPGLHSLIKRAADLLDEQGAAFNDLRWHIEDRIAVGIDVTTTYTTETVLSADVTSLGEAGEFDQQWVANFAVTSETTNDEPGMDRAPGPAGLFWDADSYLTAQLFGLGELRDAQNLGTIWNHTESRAAFEARASDRASALFDEMFERELQKEWYLDLVRMSDETHKYLGLSASEATLFYEEAGTTGDDFLQGTIRADFNYGREGDDELWGRREGSPANDPGGPDALDGGSGNDILRGSGLNDFLVGGSGNDMIIAADTIFQMGTDDTARFFGLYADQPGAVSDYSIRGGSNFAIVTGPNGERDKLFGVEHLWFDNTVIELGAGNAYDEAGVDGANPMDFITAERVALLYEAALNRDGDIDLPGLNFYVDVTERNNLTDEFLAQDLMTSPEFTQNFGDVNNMSNLEFLQQVYQNILDRTPDTAGLQFYLDLLDANVISRSFALANISLSNENVGQSRDILMGLYEATTPEVDSATSIALDWSFVA